MAACENERDRLLIELLWHTGGRVSEVINIRVGDLTQYGIKMRNLKQAVPTEKHVFVRPDFLDRLMAYSAGKQPNEYIITRLGDNRPISRITAWRIVTRAGLRAGVLKKRFVSETLRPPWPHSYRHANAVQLLECGVPANAVKEQLGHSSLASTQIYLSITDAHRRELVRRATL
jgi:site-specific recombinase XerD